MIIYPDSKIHMKFGIQFLSQFAAGPSDTAFKIHYGKETIEPWCYINFLNQRELGGR